MSATLSTNAGCELCQTTGGLVLWQDACCRVVLVEDEDYLGFCRVILNRHLPEMTDLPLPERQQLMTVVFATEQVLREVLQPDKINLASLGNMTPHLHWHVIPRFRRDRHFPNPIWGSAVRVTEKQDDPTLPGRLQAALQRILQPGS
ncbi:HIT family protein [Leeia aquatica]|uniref:HIT family protein n=1 Tax=Leeia aquatica TaxID=2725557 RepID=A0A847RZI6_9NEIS|nr:HIT family protein [Leeia aquatica]NLR75091.1 HIT family protein [Leeia aquatica]